MNTRQIYCCGCNGEVAARLTNGAEIYPHRGDLHSLKFWKCDGCGDAVGCHKVHGGKYNKPLGVIANREIKNWRMKIHAKLDPLWKQKAFSRKNLYKTISKRMGIEAYHTAELTTVADCQKVLSILDDLEQWAINNRGYKVAS